MDGRKQSSRWGFLNIIEVVRRSALAVAACWLLMLPTMAAAQAMGKAVLDTALRGAEPAVVKAELPAATEHLDHRMDVAAATRPALSGAVEMTRAIPAAPAVPVVAAPAATQEARPTEAKPAVSAFEQRPIRPRSTAGTDNAGAATRNAPARTTSLPSGLAAAFQVAAALAIVLGLVFVGKALARKFLPSAGVSSGKGVVEVLARYPLCKNQSLVLVRIGTQIIALNQGKEQSQSVLVISDQAEVANIMGQIEGKSPQSIQAGFSNLLANARMDLEDPANDPDPLTRESRMPDADDLDTQLDEMAAAKRQLMELRQQVRSVRDHLPREQL